jgi:hypothetical protein
MRHKAEYVEYRRVSEGVMPGAARAGCAGGCGPSLSII